MMYVAMMASESRDWISLGKTREEAKDALLKAWNDRQHKLEGRGWNTYYFETSEELEEEYGINVMALAPGMAIDW